MRLHPFHKPNDDRLQLMSRLNEGLLTSDRQDWATPWSFFELVNNEFQFSLDAAADTHNAKVSRYYTPEQNGLERPWTGVVWCNPPYGRGIDAWVRKGFESAQAGAVVVMLIPARTDTRYWHDYVMKAHEVRLLRGRLVFGRGEARANAPFPSALVVFRPGTPEVPKFSSFDRGNLLPRAKAA